MKEADIVVVGGSAAGLTAAITARRHYPQKTTLLVRREDQVPIPCGIPYIYGTIGTPDKNLMPDTALAQNAIELLKSTANGIDRANKKLKTAAGDVTYDRLVIATGSQPIVPPVPGMDKAGVFTIKKDVPYLDAMQKKLVDAKRVVIVGGGFIGIEFADEINKMGGKQVTVVELLPRCLSLAYDDEFCDDMERHLAGRGIEIACGAKVSAIEGDGPYAVALEDGRRIPADLVILGIGAKANVDLAASAGLALGPTGGVAVDRAMKTSDDSIFACGDCAEKTSFFGGRPSTLKLASIATLEARIAGANLFALRRESPGTIGVWSTAVGNLAIGTAGLTEAAAKQQGYDVVSASVEGPNRHPGCMPGAALTKVKLVFEKDGGVLLGGQVRGDGSSGEIVNEISACVQRKMTAEDIAMFQAGTHPALTASPVAYALVNAAEIAAGRMRSVH
jgi:NADPH-dependent 2,4-dienoyl-CoA reductase/sulfur reductase-like enzyme